MSELKPCPFCGREPVVHKDKYDDFRISCPDWDCPASNNNWFESREEAVEAWNTRAERTCRNIAEEWHEKYYGEEYRNVSETSFVCSECGARLCDAEDYYAYMGVPMKPDNWKYHDDEPVHYCPNCGAKVVDDDQTM